MQLEFQIFEEGPSQPAANEMYVTLSRDGRFFFNKNAVEALGEPAGITLMYDPRRSVIGVKSTPLSLKSTYRFQKKYARGSGSRIVTAKNFLKRFHIDPDHTLQFLTPEIRDNILLLNLTETRPANKK